MLYFVNIQEVLIIFFKNDILNIEIKLKGWFEMIYIKLLIRTCFILLGFWKFKDILSFIVFGKDRIRNIVMSTFTIIIIVLPFQVLMTPEEKKELDWKFFVNCIYGQEVIKKDFQFVNLLDSFQTLILPIIIAGVFIAVYYVIVKRNKKQGR